MKNDKITKDQRQIHTSNNSVCIYEERRLTFFAQIKTAKLSIYDLQRFAKAENEGRTELPSERYKREERNKGNVLRSQEITKAAILIGVVLVLFMSSLYMLSSIKLIFKSYFEPVDAFIKGNLSLQEIKNLFYSTIIHTTLIIAPIGIISVLMAIVANVAQFGLVFSAEPLSFKLERIVPDFKRVLPNARTTFNLFKLLVQILSISVAAYLIIMSDYLAVLKSANTSLAEAIWIFAWVSFKILTVSAVILAILSIPDYLYERHEYLEKLKMTVSESRRERKEEEGDPWIRQRQRDAASRLRQDRNVLYETAKADVLITNPTHYAVALQYDQEFAPAPVIIAKGSDHLAFLMRNIAKENEIHIEENPSLARFLYDEVEIGKEIPENLYKVVSTIFAKLRRFQVIQNN